MFNSQNIQYRNQYLTTLNTNQELRRKNKKLNKENKELKREVIKNNKGGYLVEVNDINQTVNKMNYCINNYNEALFKTKYARLYLNRFLIKNGSNLYLNFLNKVLTEKKL